MKISNTYPLSFAINHWSHLYSLQKAIKHNNQQTGRKLSIHGRLLKQAFLQHQDTDISIHFLQSDLPPAYDISDNGDYILGLVQRTERQLSTEITVDRAVFEELRKNLMEYADIEGIHVVVSMTVFSESETWQNNEQLKLIQLDYAMKGDA